MSSDTAKTRHISEDDFRSEIEGGSGVALVDFWAEWCGPCRMLGPTIDEIAEEYDGRVIVAKMDIDTNQTVPAELGIQSIPTVLFFKDGELVHREVGLADKGRLTATLDQLLG